MTIAVVGAGMIGSAAARHLAEDGQDVVLIGPGEPADKRNHTGVFASHHDEGRITRRLATSRFWSRVSGASIARYRDIETRSGIPFFTPAGAMMAAPAQHEFIRAAQAVRDAERLNAESLSPEEVARRFPFFRFPGDVLALYEAGAGHISPRGLVAAQRKLARDASARWIEEEVLALSRCPEGVRITTPSGQMTVDKAIIATGAMSDHLAPRPAGQTVYARTIAFFEISESEAQRLARMPSLVFREDGPAEPYLLPPIRYPDGKIYVKLGGDPEDRILSTPQEIGDWFRSGGNGRVRDHLHAQIRRLMPALDILSVTMEACVTTFTPSGRPVIDWLDERIAFATGGNGAAAKCSDELGRLAACLILGREAPHLSETTL